MMINLLPAVIVAGGLWNDAHVDVFWSSVAERLPKLCVIAQTYKNVVCIIVLVCRKK